MGLCVRERLGGLKACSVFALLFVLLVLVFILLPCFWGFAFVAPWLVLLSALFVLVSLWVLLFLFPFRTMRKKKGRKVFLRPLLSRCGLVYKSLNITVICCGSSFQ